MKGNEGKLVWFTCKRKRMKVKKNVSQKKFLKEIIVVARNKKKIHQESFYLIAVI